MMAPTMCFLCCAVAVLSILSCEAQLTPLLLPLSAIKSPLKPGLLAVPAARLAAANTALNVLSQGAKIPKVPLGKPLGLSLATKALKPPGLPLAPSIKPLKSPKLGSTLIKSKIPKKATSVRLRSIDDEEGAEYLESLRSDEQNDAYPGEISDQNSELNPVSSNENVNENSPDHLFKPRSPDQIESIDEFDYLTKAANPNPTEETESGFKSFVHKVEHGIANTFKKIDETFRPHSKHPEEKKEMVSSPNDFNNQNEDRIIIDNNAMEEYIRNLNNQPSVMLNYPYTTENIESVRNAMNQFQQRLSLMRSKSTDEDALSKISSNEANAIEDIQQLMSHYVDDKSTSMGQDVNQSIGDNRFNQRQMDYPYYISSNGLEYNPEYDGIWDPYNNVMSKLANAYFGNGYSFDQYPSPYESGLYQPGQVHSESGLFKRDTPEDFEASSNDPSLTRNSRQMSQFGGMPAAGIVNSALDLSQGIMGGDYGKISQAGVNLGTGIANTANGNSRQMSPSSFRGMPAGGIVNSALDLSQGIMRGDYGKISQAGVNLGTGIANTATGNSRQMSPASFGGMPAQGIVNSALDLSQGIMRGDYDKISKAGVNLGTGIANTATGNTNPEYYKTSSPGKSQNMWNSANDLADSITNAAKNPNNIGTDQVFGSMDKIWNSANNLASNIGEGTKGNLKNSPLASLINNKYSSGAQENAGNIYNSATGLASSITNVAKNPTQIHSALSNPLANLSKDRPIGSIFNSANNLAQSIVKSAGGLSNQAKIGTLNQLMKLNAATNKATSMAGKLANSAVNTGTSGLNQLLGYNSNSYPVIGQSGIEMAKQIVGTATGYPMMQKNFGSPTYAGGYFPRGSQADNIWNSANTLASNIYSAGKYPSLSGNQGYNSFYDPFQSIWGSATNLAQDITNTAMNSRMQGIPYYYYKK